MKFFDAPLFGALEYLKSKTQRVMATGVFTNVNDLARNPIATQQIGDSIVIHLYFNHLNSHLHSFVTSFGCISSRL